MNSLDKNNKTFSIIDTNGNTLKITTTEETKFIVGSGPNTAMQNVTFSDFVTNRFYYVLPSGELATLPAKYGTPAFDETIKGISIDENTIEAQEISWWVQ